MELKWITKKPNKYIIEDDVCKIECINRKQEIEGYALIDLCDIDRCLPNRWFYAGKYIMSNTNGIMYLHHYILDIHLKGIKGDHKDGNAWNNRRCNLRECTNAQNTYNRLQLINNKSGYKGVTWHKATNKWCAQIMKDGKQNWLGLFNESIDAARAYNGAASELFGEFAKLNIIKPTLLKRIK